MRNPDRTPTAESVVFEFRERVRLLSARRADLAWKALLDQVHARSESVVDTLLAACNGSTLRRLVVGSAGQVSTHPLVDEGCVGELGVQRVLVTLRLHLREGARFCLPETEAGPSERFGVAVLRRHRTELLRIFESAKEELWTSVTRAALLEAGALVARMDARCSDAEIESLRRSLSKEIDGRHSPLETGAELSEVAEHVAAEEVLAILGGRPRRAATGSVSWKGGHVEDGAGTRAGGPPP
jgi:hypothetical protein